MRSIAKKVIFLMSVALGAGFAYGSGDQVKTSNPLYDNDGEVIGISVPAPACENYVVVPGQSGKVLYVICSEED